MKKNKKHDGDYAILLDMVKEIGTLPMFTGDVLPSEEEILPVLNARCHRAKYATELLLDLLKKYPKFLEWFSRLSAGYQEWLGGDHYLNEPLNDFEQIICVNCWRQNKQVFRFDRDLLSELMNTETLRFTRGLYDRLPFNVFYLDFSENEALAQEISAQGCFIRMNKVFVPETGEEFYEALSHRLHLTETGEGIISTDLLYFPNWDCEDAVEETIEDYPVLSCSNTGDTAVIQMRVNHTRYRQAVAQALTYLCSQEPDIRESSLTRNTYRPQTPGFTRDRFSEIRAQDVGVRFGEAFRVWTKRVAAGGDRESHFTGRKNRPHARRAHWHTYHVGEGRKETIVHWLHECYINTDLGESDLLVRPVSSN